MRSGLWSMISPKKFFRKEKAVEKMIVVHKSQPQTSVKLAVRSNGQVTPEVSVTHSRPAVAIKTAQRLFDELFDHYVKEKE